MRIAQITNTKFEANPIRILAEENKHVNNLYGKIMKATEVNSPHRSGQVVYRIGSRENSIEISNPAGTMESHLKQLGIKFNV